jgi:hypothetical protein
MTSWPKQSGVDAFYGNPRGRGGVVVNPAWYHTNIIFIKPPFSMAMEAPIRNIPVHIRCAGAFDEWLRLVWENAERKQKVINDWGMNVFSGAYCFRPMRGLNRLSMHAYGCAMDFDAPRNGLHNKSPHFASLREEVVDPFIKLGGVWGGDWNGNGQTVDEPRADGMHFQFAQIG